MKTATIDEAMTPAVKVKHGTDKLAIIFLRPITLIFYRRILSRPLHQLNIKLKNSETMFIQFLKTYIELHKIVYLRQFQSPNAMFHATNKTKGTG